MASKAAKVVRKATALSRLDQLSELLAKKLSVEVPDVQVTNRDPELAEIQRIEGINELMSRMLKAGGVNVPESERGTAESYEEPKLEEMTKAELLEYAASQEIDVSKSATKAVIIEAIEAK
jgi:hypothetical protein